MSCFSSNSCTNNPFIRHLCDFIGETVIIFTTSGGPSGCGFTGLILSINCKFIRIVTQQGTPPVSPLAENVCGEMANGPMQRGCNGIGNIGNINNINNIGGGPNHDNKFRVGSICDIPIDRIVAFCHNAV